MRCKLIGSNTPQRIVRATFQGLECQETHQELAERTGKNVIEYRPEMGMRPTVVAAASLKAIEARMKQETSVSDDIAKYFDPTKGLHKAKLTRKI
eukprot:gene13852-4794_t